jgi:hypothetical protein
MNLFDFLKRNQRKETRPQQDCPVSNPRETALRDAWKALNDGEDYQASKLATSHLASEEPDVAWDARKLLALVLFRRAEYGPAAKAFREIADGRGEANDWFNLMTSSTLSGDVETGAQAYENAIARACEGDTSSCSVPFTMLYFARSLHTVGSFDKAMSRIDELRQFYESLEIADPTFLYLRGMPFLSHTLDVAVDVFRDSNREREGVAWLNAFAASLDEEGRQYIEDAKTQLSAPRKTSE